MPSGSRATTRRRLSASATHIAKTPFRCFASSTPQRSYASRTTSAFPASSGAASCLARSTRLYSKPSKVTDVCAVAETSGDCAPPPRRSMRAPDSHGATVATHREAGASSPCAAACATGSGRMVLGTNEMLAFERHEEGVHSCGDVFRRHLELLLKPITDLVSVQALFEERPDARARGVQLEDPVALEMHEDCRTAHVSCNDSRTRA